MNLTLVDDDPDVVAELERAFAGLPVAVHQGDILLLARDTLVSPANTLGLMDGVIEAEYTRYFGPGLEELALKTISRLPAGRAEIGSAFIIPTGDAIIERLLITPTVLVPGPAEPAAIFFAMSAALKAAAKHREVRDLFAPGLGTGIGQVPADVAAHEMADAYRKWSSTLAADRTD